MSATRFKVGDKVKVRKDLEVDYAYGKYLFTSSMERLVDKVNVITGIHRDADAYLLNHRDEGWTDEMLEPAEKTLDNLCTGDAISRGSGVRKVLAAVDGCYLLSNTDEYTVANDWYTATELKDMGYQVLSPGYSITLIEINGKKYSKYDVEAAIKDLEPIDPSDTDS